MEKKDVKIEIKDIAGKKRIKLLEITGVLDTITCSRAEEIINPLIAEGNNLILDCSNLTYLNTAGLVLLIKCFVKMKRRDGDFKIVNPNKLIYEIMDLAGMFNFFKSYPTQEEAIKNIEQAQ